MKRQRFSKEFKDAIVTKIMSRGSDSIATVCEREGILQSTAANWLSARTRGGTMTKQKSSKSWTTEQKLKAVFETSALSEEELGACLRREGLDEARLREWRDEMIKGLTSVAGKPSTKKDARDDKIKELERDLRRKNRVLAEASALLMLQKK